MTSCAVGCIRETRRHEKCNCVGRDVSARGLMGPGGRGVNELNFMAIKVFVVLPGGEKCPETFHGILNC